MNTTLPFFNWSLNKILSTETTAFNKARIKILYVFLLFSLVKIGIVVSVGYYYGQHFQIVRALIAGVFYIICLKMLLFDKAYIKAITHTMICIGILIILSNVVSIKEVNILTLQFVFMITISSFYLLDSFWGILYSCLSVLPVVLFLLVPSAPFYLSATPEKLAAPGTLIMIILNFITIIIAHYLYHQAFDTNVAEKDSLNVRLKEAVQEANKLAQSKSDFLSTMSHELRTPLNSVIGITDLLLDSPHDTEQEENLRALKFSGVSLHTLINNILDFNKLDSHKLHLEAISINLEELMNNICSGLALQAKEKGLKLVLQLDEELKNRSVITDPTRLTQIIYNLAGNAVKFTAEGSVSVSLQCISTEGENIKIRFSVADTGIGINADKQKDIFEPFVQASTSITRNFGGTGLGLSIVNRLITLFDAAITLDSTPGIGSVFSFDITFRTDKAEVTVTEGTDQSFDLAGMRVLIAEDNPLNVFLLKRLCEKWNIETTIVENGQEAVNESMVNPYDVILMDIHMPVMDGYEAARQIKNSKKTVRIIALTASIGQDLDKKTSDSGIDDYILKPFDYNELYRKLKDIAVTLG